MKQAYKTEIPRVKLEADDFEFRMKVKEIIVKTPVLKDDIDDLTKTVDADPDEEDHKATIELKINSLILENKVIADMEDHTETREINIANAKW